MDPERDATYEPPEICDVDTVGDDEFAVAPQAAPSVD